MSENKTSAIISVICIHVTFLINVGSSLFYIASPRTMVYLMAMLQSQGKNSRRR